MSEVKRRRLCLIVIGIVAIAVAATRVWFHVVPRGASVLPYLIASCDAGVIVAPDGRNRVAVVFNDAGAAHSGNFWTWVVKNHWLFGKSVVAEGYSGAEVRYGEQPFPLKWLGNRRFVVQFLSGRYSGEDRRVKGSVSAMASDRRLRYCSC